jgi:hypothetical protein
MMLVRVCHLLVVGEFDSVRPAAKVARVTVLMDQERRIASHLTLTFQICLVQPV